jgi:nucleoside-diphosphate-sugar epimerase
MKILVTGCAGYIGSTLVGLLLDQGHIVTGIDLLMFGNDSIKEYLKSENFRFHKKNIGDIDSIKEILNENNIEAVVHLAAIVGDPACSKQPELAYETNWVSSKKLFDLCIKTESVKRFVFASTCSNYGKMNGEEYVNEDSPLRPVSLYAELKVKFEKYLLETETREDFIPTALRFATVYGLSPRMRFDLTINEFVRDVSFGNELVVYGEQFWRPYCHVTDLARGCVHVLNADKELVKQNVFNIGDTEENYQKKMLVDEIQKVIPDSRVKYVSKKEDPRDYKVDFTKVSKMLDYKITRKVPDGIKEINAAINSCLFNDAYSSSYRNI